MHVWEGGGGDLHFLALASSLVSTCTIRSWMFFSSSSTLCPISSSAEAVKGTVAPQYSYMYASRRETKSRDHCREWLCTRCHSNNTACCVPIGRRLHQEAWLHGTPPPAPITTNKTFKKDMSSDYLLGHLLELVLLRWQEWRLNENPRYDNWKLTISPSSRCTCGYRTPGMY